MFFYIGSNCPLTTLKQVEPRLFLDDGWNHKNGIWYKGYSTECVLEDSVYDIVNGYQPAGKYCVICAGEIYHPLLRGFPVYEHEDVKTNLKFDDFSRADYKTLEYQHETDTIDIDQAAIRIGDILIENTENFFKYNDVKDITVIFSCGLDTSTCWAIQEKVSPKFNLSIHIPNPTKDNTLQLLLGTEREYDSQLIAKVGEDYWGYLHACYYKNLNWSNTGYYAEVYTYRDAIAINGLANHFDKTIDNFANPDDYLYWFLKRPSVKELFEDLSKKYATDDELKRYLWFTIWHDHQMWHLDHNMMFCPFADVRIPMIMNKLTIGDIAYNAVSGVIQRKIIERFKPELLSLISDYKNEKDVWKNFRDNFNESIVHPDTKLIYR